MSFKGAIYYRGGGGGFFGFSTLANSDWLNGFLLSGSCWL